MASTNYIENIYLSRQRPRSILSISGCGTDCIYHLRLSVCICTYRLRHFEKSLQLNRRLRNNQRGAQFGERRNFARVANDIGVIGRITNHTDHFRMVRITSDHDIPAVFRRAFSQVLDPGNERTRCIYNLCRAVLQVTLHLGRNSVRANDSDGVAICLVRHINRRDT